ncbi:MAG: glycosyltransferase family 4 protein [Lentimicrobium sp.]|uniref:glycosyltransferase family 4 protein n=1 Tax=Lentimicrobium sp. TaxID=2034841 RepID=UPI0025E5C8F9|nr:glycosyltransferase family 4 protein [Lentimicrobium sp.]MCO5257609.1 glycosyltransferase family 4 protein [Lentimicrobium sp.]
MNIVFLTLSRFTDISDRGIYPDLVRKFCNEGHYVYVVSPMERKFKKPTSLITQGRLTLLKLRTLNLQQSGIVEKGLAYMLLDFQFLMGVRKYFDKVQFDLILYSTPPINILKVVRYLKNRNNAITYLLLKDIYPQAAVDDKVFGQNSLIYKYFRNLEKQLYQISDFIGCMSEANVAYLLNHNPELSPDKVEVNPNSIEPVDLKVTDEQKTEFRIHNGIPAEALIFIYGGNLGKSQGIEFYLEVLKSKALDSRFFFLTVGSGSEFNRIDRVIKKYSIGNARLIPTLPKDEFDKVVSMCDVGLIFLNSYFTVPNFPSRILSYMEQKKPVLAATDSVTDIGKIIIRNLFGYWVMQGDKQAFLEKMDSMFESKNMLSDLGINGYNYLLENYTVSSSYNKIIKHV